MRVIVNRRAFLHKGINVGNRNQNLDVTVRQRLRHRELIKIA